MEKEIFQYLTFNGNTLTIIRISYYHILLLSSVCYLYCYNNRVHTRTGIDINHNLLFESLFH